MESPASDIHTPSDDQPEPPLSEETGQPARLAEVQHLSMLSEKYLFDLNNKSRSAPKLTQLKQFLRILHRVRQWVKRKSKELIQLHWDICVFDVVFGSLKAFIIYPMLFFAGLTWTIPIMEYLPLNTQLWTAGYLFCRRHILSKIGQYRYGHSLNEMNEFRDTALGIQPRDARNIHRFEYESVERTVRIRRSRFLDWMRKLRGKVREPNVVLQSELRKMISDKEFLFQANEIRNNAYLYEEIAIRKILTTPGDRPKLLKGLVPESPFTAERDKKLLDAMGESLTPAYARVIEQGNSLTATLRINLGNRFSATSLSLRWLNWSYQRTIYRKLAELDVLHYRLLADVLNGISIDESEPLLQIRRKEEEIRTWVERATTFGEQAKAVTTKPKAHRLIQRGIRKAQSFGLKVRLARTAYWLSPSARQAG